MATTKKETTKKTAVKTETKETAKKAPVKKATTTAKTAAKKPATKKAPVKKTKKETTVVMTIEATFILKAGQTPDSINLTDICPTADNVSLRRCRSSRRMSKGKRQWMESFIRNS